MKSKGKLLVAFLIAIGGIAVNAQGGPPPDRQRGRGPMAMNIETLKTELKLSEEQCKKLKPILDKIKSIFEAERPQGRPDSQSGPRSGSRRGPRSGPGAGPGAGSKPGSESDSQQKRGDQGDMFKKMLEMQIKILTAIEPSRKFLNDKQYEKLKDKFTRPPESRHERRPDKGNDRNNSKKSDGPPDEDKDL